MKKNKDSTSLSGEPLKNPFPSRFCFQRKPILKLTSKSLSQQRIKRRIVTYWEICLTKEMGSQKRVKKVLGQILKLDKSTQNVFLYYGKNFESSRQTNQDMLHLTNSLKGLKCIREIRFSVGNGSYLTDKGLCYLIKGLKRLCRLKNISLMLDDCQLQVTDNGLDYISRGFKKMRFLENLYLSSYYFEQITEKGVAKLNGSLNRLTKLEDLTLKIPYCPGVSDMGFSKINYQKLISLRNLAFYLPSNQQLTDKCLDFLAQGLRGLPNLQCVILDFRQCLELSNKGLFHLWEMMNNLLSLRRFDLSLLACPEINAVFRDMNRTLRCLDSIRELHLDFFDCEKITYEGLVDLCQALEKFASLESLSIDFTGCAEITDLGAKEIIVCMKKLKHLESLSVDLQDIKITKAILKDIEKLLESQTSLNKVTIELGWHCIEIDSLYDKLKTIKPDLDIKFY